MHANRVMRPRCVLALSAAVLMMASLTGCSPEPARPTPPTEGVAPAAASAKPLERHGASGQVYRAIPARRVKRRLVPALEPALAPAPWPGG